MAKNVLITGGMGLIGNHLRRLLLEEGFEVSLLSRKKQETEECTVYEWDLEKGFIETGALENADYIVHLAGAGVADERWTDKRKEVIINSRVQGLALIGDYLKEKGLRPKALVSASATGYYGEDTGDRHHIEDSPAGQDFLSEVSKLWEKAADRVSALGIRTVKLRTGVVLAKEGGALQKIAKPARFGLAAPLGSGRQWMSWIHMDDICRLYLCAIKDESWQGPYNAVTAAPVTNKVFTRQICKALGLPLWLPNVPEFALRAVFGDMASMVLGSNYVVNWRIARETNFKYKFPELTGALKDLLSR